MAEPSENGGRLVGYLVTGAISLVVAVAGGWLLNYVTEKRTALEYQVVNSEAFSGEQQNIAISTITIRNSGKKELENIYSKISFSNATITESKVTGIPKSESKATQDVKEFQLTAPFLNPDEKVTIQLLLKIPAGKIENPSIEVRGKGITGKDTTKDRGGSKKGKESLWILVTTAMSAIVPMFLMLTKLNPKILYSKKHNDDQRDVMAYILDINGLYDDSLAIRNSQRSLSYWSQVDCLTQKWINAENESVAIKGIKSLENLIEYAQIAETSKMLIYYNIARLSYEINDITKAKANLELALKGNHKVILKRIQLDDKLKVLDSHT